MSAPHGRTFIKSAMNIDGKSKPGNLIRCRDCGKTEVVLSGTHSGSLPPEVVAKKFAQKGWLVGHRVREDRCPACLEQEAIEKAKKKQDAQIKKAMEIEMQKADAPPEMTKEDRRIIFAEIDDHYVDEMRGYDAGWSDAKIAEGLKVPMAWVRQIREDNFGPEFGYGLMQEINQMNEAINKGRNVQERINTAIGNFMSLLQTQDRVLNELKKEKIATDQAINDLSKRINDLMKRVN